jgi:hypothetical protein
VGGTGRLQVQIDDSSPREIRLAGSPQTVPLASGLPAGEHRARLTVLDAPLVVDELVVAPVSAIDLYATPVAAQESARE